METIKQNSSKNMLKGRKNGSDINAQLERDPLSKALKKEGLGLDTLSLEDILHCELSDEHLKCIYFTTAYIINNYFGASDENEDAQKLSQYIKKLCTLPSKIRADYSKKAGKVKNPNFILDVQIIEAKNLIPTDANCLSDPYCKIWLCDQKELMKKTSVKEENLNPVWKERFDFSLNDVKKDVIHIEVWDQDPTGFVANMRQIINVKGLKGARIFCRECCRNVCTCGSVETDDFVAKVDLPVNQIYSTGFDSWMILKDIKNRCMNAELHISAEFKTLRPKYMLDALKRHLLLQKICLKQSIEEYKEPHSAILYWEELLSPPAVTLIFQHSVQSSLNFCENILCRFIAFVYFMQNIFSPNHHFLFNFISETYEKTKELMSSDNGLDSSLKDLYDEAVNKVYEICKSVITNLHSISFVEDENQRVELEYTLKCANLSHDIVGGKEFLWPTFNLEATIWYDKLASEMNSMDSDKRIDFISKSLSLIFSHHLVMDEILRNVFPDKSYTQFTFEVLDSVLSKNLKPHIANFSDDYLNSIGKSKELILQKSVELFIKIKELKDYVIEITQISESDLQLTSFREWFGCDAIEDWFQLKEQIVISQINQIISKDNLESQFVEVAGRVEKQSSSVTLTAELIQKELIQLRNYVFHPKYAKIDTIFLKILHSVCLKYSEFLIDTMDSRNMLADFQSTGKVKLCTIANNLWSLSAFVEHTLATTVKTISNNNYDTKFNLRIACRILCADICNEFERDIVNRIQNIVEAKSYRKQNQAVKAYVNNMKRLLSEEAMPHMAFAIYLLFIKNVTEMITNAVIFFKENYIDTVTFFEKCIIFFWFRMPNIASGLLAVLEETEKLCFVDEQGKVKEILWNADYKALKNELYQSAMP